MRLLLHLKAAKDQLHEHSYNRYTQAFVYNLTQDTKYDYLHKINKVTTGRPDGDEGRHVVPFCFSGLFPYGTMKYGDKKSLIVSSPDEEFISVLRKRIIDLKSIYLGDVTLGLTEVVQQVLTLLADSWEVLCLIYLVARHLISIP